MICGDCLTGLLSILDDAQNIIAVQFIKGRSTSIADCYFLLAACYSFTKLAVS